MPTRNTSFSLSEYYLWRKHSEAKYPWDRTFLNADFLKYEQKRLDEVKKWYTIFTKAPDGSYLDEVVMYTIPVKLSTKLKAAIAMRGDYNYIGLCALYNDLQFPVLALFPRDVRFPDDYRLIRIIKSKKIHLAKPRSAELIRAILVEDSKDWEYLPSDYVYIDVPFEKRLIQKIFEDYLPADRQMAMSLQSPILSAPYVMGDVGGISLASLAAKSTFAIEFIKTIQLMVPPEYRKTSPPKSVYNGKWYEYNKDIKFRLAERPPQDQNLLSGIYANNYNPLINELSRRYKFVGEYSVFSTLLPERRDESQFLSEMFDRFTDTEVTLPYEIDELQYTHYIELTKIRKTINEDIWLQVVYSRQINPSLPTHMEREIINAVTNIKETLENDFSEFFSNTRKKLKLETMVPKIKENLVRIAQSFARADEKERVLLKHLKQSRDIIKDNLYKLLSHQSVRRDIEIARRKEKRRNPRYIAVQEALITKPYSTIDEIWEFVKDTRHFTSIEDLVKMMDWLHKRGYVIRTRDGRYDWVGPPPKW